MSIYSRATLGTADNQIVFNDYTGATDPVYRALARSANKYQIRQQDLPVPFEGGMSDFLTLLGETSYIIQGKMYPSGESTYDAGLMALRAVCSLDLNQADILSDEGYVPYVWGDASDNKQIFMKPLYVELSETTQQGFVQPFQILAKIKDPTIYGSVLKTASTAQANPSNTTGTFVLPQVLPAPIGVTTYTVTADANNVGNIPSYPTAVTVVGPATNPIVTNTSTGESFQVNVTLSTGSDVLTLIYDKDTFTITKNGVNVASLLTNTSVLWKLHPGDNVIQLSGTLSTGAYATVTYYDSWALS